MKGLTAAWLSMAVAAAAGSAEVDVWIGTGNDPASEGIYHATIDSESGRLDSPTLATDHIRAAGFLAAHPTKPVVYAVGTVNDEPAVAAFRIAGPGELSPINHVAIGDGTAAHVNVHPGGGMLATAQYGGGSVATFRLNDDGSIAERTGLLEFDEASGVNRQRQMNPHPHCVEFSTDGNFAFVADLGADSIRLFQTDRAAATLEAIETAPMPKGSGPRHLKYLAGRNTLAILGELDLTLNLAIFDQGCPNAVCQTRTFPLQPEGNEVEEVFASASEIRVHPNGRFIYAATRGVDAISVFRITGRQAAEFVEMENARAVTPRNFNLTPDGRWLLSAGQDSHTLAVFDVNAVTGKLTYHRQIVRVPNPICVLPTTR